MSHKTVICAQNELLDKETYLSISAGTSSIFLKQIFKIGASRQSLWSEGGRVMTLQ